MIFCVQILRLVEGKISYINFIPKPKIETNYPRLFIIHLYTRLCCNMVSEGKDLVLSKVA